MNTMNAVNTDDLLACLGERTPLRVARQGIRAARRRHRVLLAETRAAEARYRGGLPAERQALSALRTDIADRHKANRSDLRAARLSREGRPIDLLSLLSQSRANERPVWAIVDPRWPISSRNGAVDGWSIYWQPGSHNPLCSGSPITGLTHYKSTFIPSGLPALPARVRQLIRDQHINRRAKRIGILYMPASWTEVILYMPASWTEIKPDPALVVEWRDIPGKYFALAVCGGDRARIMEWVSLSVLHGRSR